MAIQTGSDHPDLQVLQHRERRNGHARLHRGPCRGYAGRGSILQGSRHQRSSETVVGLPQERPEEEKREGGRQGEGVARAAGNGQEHEREAEHVRSPAVGDAFRQGIHRGAARGAERLSNAAVRRQNTGPTVVRRVGIRRLIGRGSRERLGSGALARLGSGALARFGVGVSAVETGANRERRRDLSHSWYFSEAVLSSGNPFSVLRC